VAPPAGSIKKYQRGQKPTIKGVADKKTRSKLKHTERLNDEAVEKAARAELLLENEAGYLEAEGLEQTHKFKQADIKDAVAIDSARKAFNLELKDFGPYTFSYSRSGRCVLLGGRKGHVSLMDWTRGRLDCELHLKETVRDVKFLHSEKMFAVAQKKYTYIYDSAGVELHCLRKHIDVNRLEFLPYHFLLVSVGKAGYLKYQDTSTGNLIVEHRTQLGSCDCMAQNPHNAVIGLGHTNGTVTMWTPNMTTPVAKMLCHRATVTSVAFDALGTYMATGGLDSQIHIWDVRKLGTKVHSYFTPGNTAPPSTVEISQTGLLGIGFGPHVQIWKDALKTKQKRPYMQHQASSEVRGMRFCPFEDVLGLGHAQGYSSLIIPGAGIANFDTFEANPFQDRKQRQEAEVHALLEKLKPEMIMLDPDLIGTVDRADAKVLAKEKAEQVQLAAENKQAKREKRRARGRSTAHRRFMKKQANVRDETREKILLEMKKKREDKEEAAKPESEKIPSALRRFG